MTLDFRQMQKERKIIESFKLCDLSSRWKHVCNKECSQECKSLLTFDLRIIYALRRLLISGAKPRGNKSCQTETINKLLHQLSAGIFIRKLSAGSAVRLLKWGYCYQKWFGPSDIFTTPLVYFISSNHMSWTHTSFGSRPIWLTNLVLQRVVILRACSALFRFHFT